MLLTLKIKFHRAIQKYKKVPLTEKMIAEVIRERRNQLMLPISDDEWEMLRKVKQTKKVQGDERDMPNCCEACLFMNTGMRMDHGLM